MKLYSLTVMMLVLLSIFFGLLLFSSPVTATEDTYIKAVFPSRADLKNYRFDPAPISIEVSAEVSGGPSFEIPIPGNKWQKTKPAETRKNVKTLAGFVHSKGPAHGMIQVLEYSPEYEINAHDWVLWMLEKEGMKTIAGNEDITEGQGPLFDVLSISDTAQGSENEPVMMRTGIFRNGKKFLLIRSAASTETFLESAHYFGLAIHRFSIHDQEMPEYIGSWGEHCMTNFCFIGPVPGPQQATAAKELISERFYHLTLNDRPTGLLNIRTVSAPLAGKTSAEDRINNILYNMVEQSGMTFDKDLIAFRGEHQNLEGNCYYARNLGKDADSRDLEFFSLSWQNSDAAVLIFMLTDARSIDPAAWIMNKRTFEIVSRSFRFK